MSEQDLTIQQMTGRLARVPRTFLGEVVVGAVLSDVLADLGHEPLDDRWLEALAPSAPSPAQQSWLQAAALVAWLLADQQIGGRVTTVAVLGLLSGDLHRLSEHVSAAQMVAEDDRREELCRLLLRAAGVVPAGESQAQAADRLATLDTANRLQVIAEARAAEARTREVREALARKRAQEAAARAMRE